MVVRFAPRRELMKSEGGAFSASSSEFWESPSRPVADLANDIVIGVEKRPEEAVGAVGAVGLFGTSSAAGNTQESGVLKFAARAQGRNGGEMAQTQNEECRQLSVFLADKAWSLIVSLR